MILVYLIGAITAILFFKFYLFKRRIMKYVGHLPSPPEIPLVGSGLYFLGKNSVEIMDMMCMATGMLDTPCRIWLGPILTVFLAKPEDIQTVMLSSKCLDKPYIYGSFMDDCLGLFSAPIHIWKPHRKLLNPTFNNKILLSFLPIFNEKSKILANVLANKVGGKPFDVSRQFYACTLEMVCATTIGVNLDFQSNKDSELLDCMESQSELIANRMTKFWLHPHFIFKWTQGYKDYRRNLACLYNLTTRVRKIKEKEFDESKCFEKVEELQEDEFFTSPQTFVNELFKLHHQKLLDDRMVDDEIFTVMVGGNETSALTMSHVILLLAMHPEYQERAYEEVRNAHQTQTSDTDADIIAKLDYLEMCIKESMRLFPVAPFLGRQNDDDVKLSNCTVPKGTMLIMSFYDLHRDKEIWGPNADIFNPDNFLPEKIASRHSFSFLPFSAGARNCIGIKYAWLSMKVVLSSLLRQYRFSTHLRLEDIITKFEVTLKIENRHLVTIERRDDYL